jgi:PAS domain S-box-containing protein
MEGADVGRLESAQARGVATAVFIVLFPLSCLLTRNLQIVGGLPGLGVTTGLIVAYLLFVGPIGGPAVFGAMIVDQWLVQELALTSTGLAAAAASTAVLVGGVVFLEHRFRVLGPARRARVVGEFLLICAVLTVGLSILLGLLITGAPWSGPDFLQRVIGDGLGVLLLVPGLRMLVLGEGLATSRRDAQRIMVAGGFAALALLVTLRIGGGAVAEAQIAVFPILIMSFLGGTVVYSIGAFVTTMIVAIPAAILLTVPPEMSVGGHATWWMVAAGGLMLAAEGDRNRALTNELQSLFSFGATPTAEASVGTAILRRANDALATITGWAPEELRGCDLRALIVEDPEDTTSCAELLDGTRRELECHLYLRCRDGSLRWVRFQGQIVDLGDSQPDVLLLQFVDMTQEREREDALRRSNVALEHFGRRVSHDLKQPLAAIAGYAATLREHADRLTPDVVDGMHERLDAAARRAVVQLDEMFDGAAVDGGGATTVELDAIVRSVVELLDIELAERDAVVETALAAPRLHTDANELQQVVLNLVSNSLKYSHPDRPPRIRVSSRVRGAGVELTVTDNGQGIPADRFEDVFSAGARLAPDAASGHGMGLADSRAIIEAAGGWLRAEPFVGGSRFVAWLPDPMAARAVSPVRVLLVDDDVDYRGVISLRLMLEEKIEVVGEVDSIAAAIAATASTAPDIVLLDRWLPNGHGRAAAQALTEAYPDVRIVVLTSDMTPELAARARSDGVLRTIAKSKSADELVRELVGAAG